MSKVFDCIFFYYHGLATETSGIHKYETIVSGLKLRLAIHERLPRCGIRLAVSAVLYAAEKGTASRLLPKTITL